MRRKPIPLASGPRFHDRAGRPILRPAYAFGELGDETPRAGTVSPVATRFPPHGGRHWRAPSGHVPPDAAERRGTPEPCEIPRKVETSPLRPAQGSRARGHGKQGSGRSTSHADAAPAPSDRRNCQPNGRLPAQPARHQSQYRSNCTNRAPLGIGFRHLRNIANVRLLYSTCTEQYTSSSDILYIGLPRLRYCITICLPLRAYHRYSTNARTVRRPPGGPHITRSAHAQER